MQNNEIWKEIEIQEVKGLYKVSNLGRIYSVRSKRFLKVHNNGNGYYDVRMFNKGIEVRDYIHRLVAKYFIPNPNNLPEVNHKDENPANNYVDNLEWCDRPYNCNYGSHNEKISKTKSTPVVGVNIVTKEVVRLKSSKQAEYENTFCRSDINKCCKKEMKYSGDYIWFYEEEFNSIKDNIDGIIQEALNYKNTKGNIPVIGVNLKTMEILKLEKMKDSLKYNIKSSSISNNIKGKLKSAGGYIWIKYDDFIDTEEFKLDLINKYKNNKTRGVIGINKDNGEILEFNIISDAKQFGFNPNTIVLCCKNKVKFHKNYSWEYKL